jgi:VWFA-related protein
MRRLPALGATLATTAFALGAAARAPAIPPLSESVRTELVQVEVWALDGNGRAVRDLRIEEIELFVDGVRHPAVAFDPVSAADASDRAAVGPGPPGAAPPGIAWPRRMMLFFNDVLSMPEHMTAARRAAAAFLRDAGHEGDLYALASYSQRSHLRVALDFTSRRERALTAVEATLGDTARVSELMLAVSAPPPDGADPSRPISNAERARQVANEQETLNFQIQAAGHGVRDAFGALIDLLAPYPGHKAIVFFGDGLRGLTRQEVERLARDAAAAGVTIHAANTEGLTLGSPPRQQALIALADETGGVRTVSNDVGAVLRAAGAAMDGGYVLSFAPTGAADGTGHPLRLVCRRRGVTLRHRQEFRRPLPSEARERELQASFVAPDLRAGFGLQIAAIASGAGDLVLFVPSGRLLYLPGPSGRAARFEVGVVAQDEDGREIARLSRRLELRQEGDDPRGPARR